MNKVILMGRLTKEPDLRYTNTSNIPVCRFTLAVDRRYAKKGEDKQTDFIPIVAWNKLAEFCGKFFIKGGQVVIVGKMQNRSWDDNEGKKHYVTEVMADEAYFAGGNTSNSNSSNSGSNSSSTSGAGNTGNAGNTESTPGGIEDMSFFPLEIDDELPF
jgi:single-strand DNA-binding protein